MKIELVSFVSKLNKATKLNLTATFINESTADLILFPGHTIKDSDEIEALRQLLTNKTIEAVLELGGAYNDIRRNFLYRVSGGMVLNTNSHQFFANSKEIEGNYPLAESFLDELLTNRTFKLRGKSFLILQCGEINLFKNIQSEGNRVEFRLKDDKRLLNKVTTILNQTDVILNPMHTPMGNQGKMAKRREFLSKHNKYYFSTSNTPKDSMSLKLRSLQYALFNGSVLHSTEKDYEFAISKTYSLK